MADPLFEGEGAVATEEPVHPARGRRERIRDVEAQYEHQVVKVGSQQAGAIATLSSAFKELAVLVETAVPEGPQKTAVHQQLLAAKLMTVQAISHR